MNISKELFHMQMALNSDGIYVGVRDPRRNTDYKGEFMICESPEYGEYGSTKDAESGGYCIVGNDLDEMIIDAYNHFFP